MFPERMKVEHDLREEVNMSLKSVRQVRERKEWGKVLIFEGIEREREREGEREGGSRERS